jgi:hypothetical protein
MKSVIRIVLALLSVAVAVAATPVPSELVGIWATEGAEFQGEANWNGSALYLDTD